MADLAAADFQPYDPAHPGTIEATIGAGEGIRTLDPDLGKVVLYP
jgi:hypothetical protein